ncbi:MBL fold metallo-hydrolase [Psychrobacter sp.]|uniref:MBL fold metallo-hydrolase n=1 Tax=Psychrobacter sp. TaxID=56811 RepID=UPI0025EDED7B|nr:MBL fold metallo-hydrolase [Psychrobacter sp.]
MSLQQIVAIKGYIQTTYLAVYPDKLLLLDAGCYSDVEKIISYITETLNRPLDQLKLVMVTHMHPDHAGGAKRLQQLTGCQIATAAHYKPWYNGVTGKLSHLNDLMLTYYVANRQGKHLTYLWYNPKMKADLYVHDGDTIPNFDDWQVLSTAGHTDRDISLWHKETRQVYVADLILKIKAKFVSPFLITLPYVYRESVTKIRDLQPDTVILAHGGFEKLVKEDYNEIIAKAPQKPRKMTILHSIGIMRSQLSFGRKRAQTP